MATGGKVVIDADHGWVTLEVADQLSLLGEVVGLGGAEERLLVTYVGTVDATVSGSFKGTILAPQARLTIDGGQHAALFYGDRVVVTGDAQVGEATSSFGEQLAVTPSENDDKKSDERGTTLVATASTPASGDLDSDEVVVPYVLPVAAGNAGNGLAVLTLVTPSGSVSCEYRGGASSLHPTTLDERAKGREYAFVQCSDATPAGGTVANVTNAGLALEGDNQDIVADTRVNLSLGDSCRGDLPQPVSPARSRELINAFSWNNAQPVIETTQDGEPALYYAYLYIEDQEDLDTAQRMLIHTQTMPLFPEEMQKFVGHCGTIGMEGDGEGTFIFAVIPGVTYNAILALRSKEDVAEEQREPFRAIILRQPPVGMNSEHGELDLTEQVGRCEPSYASACLPGHMLGVTYLYTVPSAEQQRRIVEGDLILDLQLLEQPEQLLAVARHELGHLSGLRDASNESQAESVMHFPAHPRYHPELQGCDVAAVQALYSPNGS